MELMVCRKMCGMFGGAGYRRCIGEFFGFGKHLFWMI